MMASLLEASDLVHKMDHVAHRVTIIIAGHMAPILYTAAQTIVEPGNQVGGPPLGLESSVDIAIRSYNGIAFDAFELELQPGESLTLYTDGIHEAPNAQDVRFSIDRVRNIVGESGGGHPKGWR